MPLETTAADAEEDEFVDELKPGTKLMLGQYTIDDFLAAGGFGITYLARDSLNRRVVIKECFPGNFCRRQNTSVTPRSRAHQNELKSIVRLFTQEAMSLAKTNHPNIVGVHQVFEENNTAYMALDYVQGRDLLEILEDDPDSLTPEVVEGYLEKTLDAIKHIHNLDMLHRDISPDNIIITEQGEPILIDFGAARESSSERVTRMLSALRVVKDGYSPQEFYIAGSEQTPSCDLYSLAASFYHLITRELPPDSQWRLSSCASGDEDPYVSLGEKTKDYSKSFVSALDKAMAILPRDRMQDAEEWLEHMSNGTVAAPPKAQGAAKPSTGNAEKKSFMPVLLGTTALAAAVGAGFFFMRSSEPTEPTGTLESDEVAAVQTPVTPSAEAAPEPVETVSTTPTESVAPASLNTFDPAAGDEGAVEVAAPEVETPATDPETATLPIESTPTPAEEETAFSPVTEPTTEVATLPLPTVEETTDFVFPLAILALPEQMAIPQPRPFRDAEATVASLDDELPTVDTVAPEAPAPVAAAESEPAQQVAVASGTQASLEFFMSMTTSEPDLISIGSPRASTAAAAAEPEQVAGEPSPSTSDLPTVITRYVPLIPFELSPWSPGVVVSVTEDGPEWLTESSRIVSIEGDAVVSNEDIIAALRALAPQDNAGRFEVTIGLDSGLNTAVTERTLTIQKEQHTLLLSGLRFVSREHDAGWITKVAEVPSASNLQVGDVLVSYVSTWEDIDRPDTLQTILERELANGKKSFSFAVSREGEIWIEAFNLAALN